jgi:hypothetical protein
MGQAYFDGSFQFPGAGNALQVSDTLEADASNTDAFLYVSVRFHGGGATVVLETIPKSTSVQGTATSPVVPETNSGIAGSPTANWTTVATYTTDQQRTAQAIDRTKIYRLRASVAGSAGTSVAYRVNMEDRGPTGQTNVPLDSLYTAAAAPGPFVG